MSFSTRWRSLCLFALLSLSPPAPLGGQGDRSRDVSKVLVLQGVASGPSRELLDGFRRRFTELGRKVDVVVVEADNAAAVAGQRNAGGALNLVLALGARASALAVSDFRNTPTVGAMLARESALPDGSGAAAIVLEFPLDLELEWVQRVLPHAHRIGVLYGSDDNARLVVRARDIARTLGLELVARRVNSPADIPAALAAIAGSADVLWGIPDDVVLNAETAKAVLLSTLRSKIPLVGLSAQWVRAGAIFALDRDYADLGAQTADVAARILDGTSPRAVGTVRPRKILYSVNARSAELMRITLGSELLRGATEVVR